MERLEFEKLDCDDLMELKTIGMFTLGSYIDELTDQYTGKNILYRAVGYRRSACYYADEQRAVANVTRRAKTAFSGRKNAHRLEWTHD